MSEPNQQDSTLRGLPKQVSGPDTSSTRQKLTDFAARTAIVTAVAMLAIGGFNLFAAIADRYTLQQFFDAVRRHDGILYVASWIVLMVISVLATLQVREVLQESRGRTLRQRANYIAVIIGLVLVIILFKQPFLDQLFGNKTTGGILKTLLFGGGIASGWLVWYLRQLQRYGEFFHVLLFTVVIGFCWYARLTAPEEIQLTAVAFLLGSLCRLAKDYLDAEVEGGGRPWISGKLGPNTPNTSATPDNDRAIARSSR